LGSFNMNSIRNRMPLKVLIPVLAISLFAIGSFAASVGVTTTSYSGEAGVNFTVVGCFTAASNGFQVVQSSQAASGSVTWSNGTTCHTALIAGDWYYQVKLTIAANATVSHLYTVTVQWNTGSGYATLGSSLTFTTPSTITAGQIMFFQMDTGVTSFNAPAAITVTVA